MATTTFIHVKNDLILDTIFEFSINHPETDIVLTIDRKKLITIPQKNFLRM